VNAPGRHVEHVRLIEVEAVDNGIYDRNITEH
jgi:hypothetical protein